MTGASFLKLFLSFLQGLGGARLTVWIHYVDLCALLPSLLRSGAGGCTLSSEFTLLNSLDSIQTKLAWVLSHFKGERTEATVHHRSGSPKCSPEEVLHKGCLSLHWFIQHPGSEQLTTHKQAVLETLLVPPSPPICCLSPSLVTRAYYVGEMTV